MTDYVLVHGGWCGEWSFDRTAEDLRAAGHRVLVASLTGLGSRLDELSPSITLSTHVADVVSQIADAGFDRFVLVGHSYGGMVVTGVATVLGARIDSLICIDGFVPGDAQSVWDLAPELQQLWILLQRDTPGLVAPPPSWEDPRLTPQPLLTTLEPVRFTGEEMKVGSRIYISATGYEPNPYALISQTLKSDTAWNHHEIDSGHFIMTDRPEPLLELLLGSA